MRSLLFALILMASWEGRADGPYSYYPLNPCRALGATTDIPLPRDTPRTFTIAGLCGVPPEAKVISINITITRTKGNGNVGVFSGGQTFFSSNINFGPGDTVANSANVTLGPGQTITAIMGGDALSEVSRFLVDVSGYFK